MPVDETQYGTVYELVDPTDGETRYIGSTGMPLGKRLAKHANSPTNRGMAYWMGSLDAQGLKPEIKPLMRVPVEYLNVMEKSQIEMHSAEGASLLNGGHYSDNIPILRERVRSLAMDRAAMTGIVAAETAAVVAGKTVIKGIMRVPYVALGIAAVGIVTAGVVYGIKWWNEWQEEEAAKQEAEPATEAEEPAAETEEGEPGWFDSALRLLPWVGSDDDDKPEASVEEEATEATEATAVDEETPVVRVVS
ncbi:hypothetical protein [Streptomyces sp. CS014]|uniref:hypothetical protein n=1 Tax=Streptomyces sp. CS014 TaxID=2162707 RepID=UPI000D50E8B5|nr:hypothetical protein [Streptomyces sp. CS014]PVD04475.1 hypothetical protein DBP12_03350 [Streptomyces sp. CS014]